MPNTTAAPILTTAELRALPLVRNPERSYRLGRCHEHGERGLAFAFKAAQLGDMTCPLCGCHLQQTTRMLRSGFRVLPEDVALRCALRGVTAFVERTSEHRERTEQGAWSDAELTERLAAAQEAERAASAAESAYTEQLRAQHPGLAFGEWWDLLQADAEAQRLNAATRAAGHEGWRCFVEQRGRRELVAARKRAAGYERRLARLAS